MSVTLNEYPTVARSNELILSAESGRPGLHIKGVSSVHLAKAAFSTWRNGVAPLNYSEAPVIPR